MGKKQQQVTLDDDSAKKPGAYRVRHTYKTDGPDGRGEGGTNQPTSGGTNDNTSQIPPDTAALASGEAPAGKEAATQAGTSVTVLPPGPEPEPGIEIFTEEDLVAFMSSIKRSNTDDDVTSRNRSLVRLLINRSAFRGLRRLPDDWEPRLNEIECDYPHGKQFIGWVRDVCTLAALDNGVVECELPHLTGAPGTGKSTLFGRFDGLLGGGYHRVSMSAAEAGNLLGGSQETWANSRPGLVFTTLTEGQFANPIILLDEIDKASTDSRFDPLGPLYQLLEPPLAAQFVDLSVPGLPLNASRIVWAATSNDPSHIPAPIRQRFVEFPIPMPTPAQSAAVARSVLRCLQLERKRLKQFTLDDSAMDALIGLAPRQMRKQISLGCGRAARAGRSVVSATDFPKDASQARRVGF